jgi:hypothetical protein
MILIFGLVPRCGSTSILKAINCSTKFDLIIEPFNPDAARWAPKLFEEAESQEDILEKILSLGADGIKHLEYQVDEELNEKLINVASKKILIYRSNQLEVCSSQWMSESYQKEFGRDIWHPEGIDIENVTDFFTWTRPPLPAHWLNEQIKKFKNLCDHYGRIFNAKDTLIIRYEDFFRPNMFSISKLCDYLECELLNEEWKQIFSPKNKFNKSPIKDKLIPNMQTYRQTEERFIFNPVWRNF